MKTIGEDLDAILMGLWEAQQEWINANPQQYAAYCAAEERRRKEDSEQAALKEYLLRGIPRGTASLLHKRVDRNGLKIVKPEFYNRMYTSIKNGSILVALAGVLGSGKTVAACGWLMKAEKGLYIKARHFVSYSEKFTDDREIRDEHYKTPALVVDEVGMEEEKDTAKLVDLLHDRFENDRVTVICLNKTPEETRKLLGERLDSRVWEAGDVIACTKILRPGEIRRKAASR